MFRTLLPLVLATAVTAGFAPSANALALPDKFADAKKAYGKMLVAGKTGEDEYVRSTIEVGGKQVEVLKRAAGAPKLEAVGGVVPGLCDGNPIACGVKVWAELIDASDGVTGTGQMVNPEKYRWAPNQRLYLWFESSVPIQVGLFQNYPAGRVEGKGPKRVLPDARFPGSYGTLLPGRPMQLPIVLKMDDNLNDELISVTVVVAGAPVGDRPLAINAPIVPGAVVNSGNVIADTNNRLAAVITNSPGAVVNVEAATTNVGGKIVVEKMDAVGPEGPAAARPVPSDRRDDVSTLLLCDGFVGYALLTFQK